MTYVNDPNDPNYVVQSTTPVVTTPVVTETVAAPVAEAVVPAPNPLRWLWWLLGLLVLAGLIWALTRACRDTTADCTTLPADVWDTTAQNETWQKLVGWDSAHFTDANRTAVLGELQSLCNRRLQGGGGRLAVDAITGVGAFSGIESGIASNILSLVNGNGFCRCS